jgi:hypothetical protein
MKSAYLKLYAYNEEGKVTDIKVIEIIDGKIEVEGGFRKPAEEKPQKEG